jgi:antitoxin Phd
MSSRQLQKAKARFSEFLGAALKNGPQVVTRRGVETAVLVPLDEWRHLQDATRPMLKELLLGEGPRIGELHLERGKLWGRKPIDLP